VLEHGRVVEAGPHSELLTTGGRYAQLWGAWRSRATADH
jgi:ATP-binding cassette subfamily C protein